QTANGQCFAPSIADPRPDAFRCSAGNAILDPCFAPTLGGFDFVLCPLNGPWGRTAERLNLAKPPKSQTQELDVTKDAPWAIQVGGLRCTPLTGAGFGVAG